MEKKHRLSQLKNSFIFFKEDRTSHTRRQTSLLRATFLSWFHHEQREEYLNLLCCCQSELSGPFRSAVTLEENRLKRWTPIQTQIEFFRPDEYLQREAAICSTRHSIGNSHKTLLTLDGFSTESTFFVTDINTTDFTWKTNHFCKTWRTKFPMRKSSSRPAGKQSDGGQDSLDFIVKHFQCRQWNRWGHRRCDKETNSYNDIIEQILLFFIKSSPRKFVSSSTDFSHKENFSSFYWEDHWTIRRENNSDNWKKIFTSTGNSSLTDDCFLALIWNVRAGLPSTIFFRFLYTSSIDSKKNKINVKWNPVRCRAVPFHSENFFNTTLTSDVSVIDRLSQVKSSRSLEEFRSNWIAWCVDSVWWTSTAPEIGQHNTSSPNQQISLWLTTPHRTSFHRFTNDWMSVNRHSNMTKSSSEKQISTNKRSLIIRTRNSSSSFHWSYRQIQTIKRRVSFALQMAAWLVSTPAKDTWCFHLRSQTHILTMTIQLSFVAFVQMKKILCEWAGQVWTWPCRWAISSLQCFTVKGLSPLFVCQSKIEQMEFHHRTSSERTERSCTIYLKFGKKKALFIGDRPIHPLSNQICWGDLCSTKFPLNKMKHLSELITDILRKIEFLPGFSYWSHAEYQSISLDLPKQETRQ